MNALPIVIRFDLARLSRLADALVVAIAVSLPWSTSATSILIVLWLLAFLPTLQLADLRQEASTAAGGLPLLLFVLGAIGMAWADVPLKERLYGCESFLRLLVIPLLLIQFRRSPRGRPVLIGFLASCVLLLTASYLVALWPGLPHPGREYGSAVKSYIAQSAEFTICAFALAYLAGEAWQRRQATRCLLLTLLAAAFLIDIFFVATSRTTLVVIPVLLIVWGAVQFGWKGAVVASSIGAVVAGLLWISSPYLRLRVTSAVTEVERYQADNDSTSAGERLEYWKKSVRFVMEAPLIGHGVGSIKEQFRNAVVGTTGAASEISTNPHNQTLTIAVQLGVVGAATLWAMWLAHLLLFRSDGAAAWLGLLVVLENIGGSMFNSFLFDFTEGWLYVFGVGVIGGMVRRQVATQPVPRNGAASAS